MDKKTGSRLSEWLDKMETESWQLELILSGFVIFLLLAGLEPYHELEAKIDALTEESTFFGILSLPYHTFRAAYYVLTVAVIFHVVLRGVWISTIGLRSVSGSIDWPSLKLASKYEEFLKRQVPSFDHYIERLESWCSVSFAFTFLMVFSIISAGMYLIGLVVVQLLSRAAMGVPLLRDGPGVGIDDILILTYSIMGLIYLIDFVTLGWVKRFKMFSKVYFPIYRFIGFITFASFYRPIYYNLIDYKLGRRLAILILPLSLVVITLMSLKFYGNSYLSSDRFDSSEYWYLENSYEDIAADNINLNRPSIQSQIIDNNYMRLFVPYIPRSHDESIEKFCPDLEPGFFAGLKLRGGISAGKIVNVDSNTKELLNCAKQLWRVSINDSTYSHVNFRFYYHRLREQYGLLAILPIHYLDKTEHFIKIDRQRYIDEKIQWYDGEHLWFYKE